ncbi:MAG: ribonuclease P protein component [bacterium]|nr:ribonuclease P protein component [bacterium]
MLPKENRLTKKNDFDLVFKKGKNEKRDFLVVKTLKNNLKESRFGFIVSKKVSSKAVVRNKVKRRLRDALQKEVDNIKEAKDIIFIALPGIEKKEYSDIKEAVSSFFNKK